MRIRELRSDADITDAFPLMSVLRPRVSRDTFLAEVRRQQIQGYELVGGFDEGRLVVLAGFRRSHTLARGAHLFVDDLVTVPEGQQRGYGTQLLRWLAALAASEGIARIYLDSRDTARGFYAKVGFTFLTSIPCWIEVSRLTDLPPDDAGSR